MSNQEHVGDRIAEINIKVGIVVFVLAILFFLFYIFFIK